MVSRRLIPLILCVLIGNMLTILPPGGAEGQAQPSSIPKLTLSVTPPKLPADAGLYGAVYVGILSSGGQVIAAPQDIPVFLSSSSLEVGAVIPAATIKKGQAYAVANFQTTATAGSTIITASSQGLNPSSVPLTTVVPRGVGVKLVVYPNPAALLPQAGSSGTVFVQLQDATGKPARAPSIVPVTLVSSHPAIANVTQAIIINAGQTSATGTISAAFATGATTITASATGLATGFAQLSVVGPNPTKLSVTTSPSTVAANSLDTAIIAVQLQASDGTPTPAPTAITVQVTSSNTTVGTLRAASIVIPLGYSYAMGTFLPLNRGISVITASAQGYTTGFSTVNVARAGSGGGGQLSLSFSLPVILADRGQYPIVTVQMNDPSGKLITSPGDVNVILTSSNANVGTIQSTLTISHGSTFGTANFTSTVVSGSTTITASASNFISSTSPLNSAGPVPYQLAVILGPALLLANGGSYVTSAVELQDAGGNPAKAASSITASLASSNVEVGAVTQVVVIPTGKSYSFFSFQSTLTPGTTQITASTPGYVSGQTVITTVPLAESALALYRAPLIRADATTQDSLVVQLQDSSGLPVKADLPVSISLTSSDPSVIRVQPILQINVGGSFAVAQVTTALVSGPAVITAQAQGLNSAYLNATSSLVPTLAVMKVLSTGPILALTSVGVQVNVTSGGYPLSEAQVTWSAGASFAKFVNASTSTDASGRASAFLQFADAGNLNVTAVASKPGFSLGRVSSKIDVKPQPLSILLIPTLTLVNETQPTDITATVTSKGKPLAGASIAWSADLGVVAPSRSTTDSSGKATVSFLAPSNGTATITAQVSLAGYGSPTQTTKIVVQPFSGGGGATGVTGGLIPTIIGYLPVVGVLVVLVLIALLVMRRRRRKSEGVKDEGKAEEAAAESESDEGES